MVPRILFLSAAIPALAAEDARPVSVAVATREPLATRLELTGTVHARHRSRLSPRTSGLTETMHVDAGDRVKQGDVLMELDSELAEIELEQIESQLEQARVELAEADRLSSESSDLASRGAFPKSEADTRRSALEASRAAERQLVARAK
ncbi:MAG: biotin/lipoyl-binding protein, partial [Verrucomicrobiae bacterium]|nr:biotin/lipoyl-binding protein [Verrucomicrobiae bacterium]